LNSRASPHETFFFVSKQYYYFFDVKPIDCSLQILQPNSKYRKISEKKRSLVGMAPVADPIKTFSLHLPIFAVKLECLLQIEIK